MKTLDGASYTGTLSRACRQCHQGSELVLFVTGKCSKKCWYCPISFERKGHDAVWANERPVRKDSDIIAEAKEMRARGAGVTGGEPLLVVDRVARYVRLLKKRFGKEFYMHLYTCGEDATGENLEKLEQAGLDEIRFHLLTDFEKALPALETRMRVGIEVPCIPGDWARLKRVVDFCAEQGIFLNLNELEFSDTNYEALRQKGFSHSESTYAVTGSRKLALKVLAYARDKRVDAHFCPLRVKYGIQLPRRTKRRALTLRKPWETVDANGFLVKGVVACSRREARAHGLHYNQKRKRFETSTGKAREMARKGFKAWKVVEYPSSEPWDFEAEPLRPLKCHAQ
jgi:hypothetical protein